MGTMGISMCVFFVKPLVITYMRTKHVAASRGRIAQLDADTRREEAASRERITQLEAASRERIAQLEAASQERIAQLDADTRRGETASRERIAFMNLVRSAPASQHLHSIDNSSSSGTTL